MKAITYASFLAFLLMYCRKPGNEKPQPAQHGALKIMLTDDPAFYTAINVNLSGIQYNTSTDGSSPWKWLKLQKPGIIDILTLQHGTNITLADEQIPEAEIKFLRLRFADSGNTVIDNGVVHPLIIPPVILEKGAIVSANRRVQGDQPALLWIDFNAATSVQYNKTTNVYTLSPRLRTFDPSQTGSLEGFIAPAASKATVTVQSENPATVPFLSLLSFPAYDNNGYFKSVGLSPGNYNVTIKPNRGGFATKVLKGVTISREQTFSIGHVSLDYAANSALPFIHNWTVHESVSKNIGGFVGRDTFNAHTILLNDSTFGIVQTARQPDPEWVLSVPYLNADTLWFIPSATDLSLRNTYQGKIGTYAANRDTLQFTYTFGAAGNYFVYLVTQKWIRQ